MAKRYGQLPSQVLETGSSIDIECANFAVGYENFLRTSADKGHKVTKHSTDQLQAMINAVKKRNENGTTLD